MPLITDKFEPKTFEFNENIDLELYKDLLEKLYRSIFIYKWAVGMREIKGKEQKYNRALPYEKLAVNLLGVSFGEYEHVYKRAFYVFLADNILNKFYKNFKYYSYLDINPSFLYNFFLYSGVYNKYFQELTSEEKLINIFRQIFLFEEHLTLFFQKEKWIEADKKLFNKIRENNLLTQEEILQEKIKTFDNLYNVKFNYSYFFMLFVFNRFRVEVLKYQNELDSFKISTAKKILERSLLIPFEICEKMNHYILWCIENFYFQGKYDNITEKYLGLKNVVQVDFQNNGYKTKSNSKPISKIINDRFSLYQYHLGKINFPQMKIH